MARKRYAIPQYGTVIMAGKEYYRTRIEDADGKRVALYGRTREELYDKVLEAREQIEDNTFRRSSPTVRACPTGAVCFRYGFGDGQDKQTLAAKAPQKNNDMNQEEQK